ncbi:hypothetical protein CDL15_Pgr014123 [Punica granatum]|uniref:Uncharacterized protein n=1 Tax=Punica granatum TaxID=22663 RepID=A0A218XYU3_PUNGR|nr:hypothetical protein CDL15_Pgr014123 [Punica granatum]
MVMRTNITAHVAWKCMGNMDSKTVGPGRPGDLSPGLSQYSSNVLRRSGIAVVRTQILSRRGTHAQSLCNAAWGCPPSRECATDTREKESPLTVYDP